MKNPQWRVAMIIQSYLPCPGGAERQLAALAPMLCDRGIAIHVITRRYPGLSAYELVGGVPVHRLPIPGPKTTASLSFTLSALPLLRRLQPDVIHAHELLSPTTTAVAAGRWLGVPVIAKVLRGGMLGDLAKLARKPLGKWRMQRFIQAVDGFAVISQEIDAELATWGVPAPKRFFIPNGVDTQRFAPVSTDAKEELRRELALPDVLTAVYAGRLAPEKCVDQLIHLWPKVREIYAHARLLILGDGPEQARLHQLATPGVHFLGQIEDVLPYLQAADLFILPSATEGLSNAMLEALAVGLPVIATNVGGAPDVIKHWQNGWLAPPWQSDSWLEAILVLFTLPELRAQLGAQGRQKVVAEYGLTATADRLAALYGRVAQPLSPPVF